MRIVVNENVSNSIITGLRARGHDVLAVKESMRGRSDVEVIARAAAERRLVVTHDKDFGELAFRRRSAAPCGVILLRLSGSSPEADCRRAIEAIGSRNDRVGHFSVITEDRVRMRPIPPFQAPAVR